MQGRGDQSDGGPPVPLGAEVVGLSALRALDPGVTLRGVDARVVLADDLDADADAGRGAEVIGATRRRSNESRRSSSWKHLDVDALRVIDLPVGGDEVDSVMTDVLRERSHLKVAAARRYTGSFR
jgi:hypothetical protein